MSTDNLSATDIEEFSEYLHACSEQQVREVFERERSANRKAYLALVRAEAQRRGITLEE